MYFKCVFITLYYDFGVYSLVRLGKMLYAAWHIYISEFDSVLWDFAKIGNNIETTTSVIIQFENSREAKAFSSFSVETIKAINPFKTWTRLDPFWPLFRPKHQILIIMPHLRPKFWNITSTWFLATTMSVWFNC